MVEQHIERYGQEMNQTKKRMTKKDIDIYDCLVTTMKVGRVFGLCELNDETTSIVFNVLPKYSVELSSESYDYLKELLEGE